MMTLVRGKFVWYCSGALLHLEYMMGGEREGGRKEGGRDIIQEDRITFHVQLHNMS